MAVVIKRANAGKGHRFLGETPVERHQRLISVLGTSQCHGQRVDVGRAVQLVERLPKGSRLAELARDLESAWT